MKILILLCFVFGALADPKADPLRFQIEPPVEDEAESYNNIQTPGQTVVYGSSGGYVYQQPPVTFVPGNSRSISCSCPPPQVRANDTIIDVPLPDIKTAYYKDQEFPVLLKEIAEMPKYHRIAKMRSCEIKRINITENGIPKDKPVILKKICEKPLYPKLEPKKVLLPPKDVKVTVEHIIEVPVYEEIFNVTYVDVPVDVVINKIIERPLPKPRIKVKYVDVEVENIIEEIEEREVKIDLERKVEKAKYIDKPYDLIDIPYVKVECIPKLVPQCAATPPCPPSGLRCPACNCPQTGTVYLPPSPVYLPSHGK